jgi:uncharacterized repeat protein (TIGR03803 family)
LCFKEVYNFPNLTNGANPQGTLILSGSTLYGTTVHGGNEDYGVVFAVSTNGNNFTILHNFTGASDGGAPWPGLILSGNTLYGTTTVGGTGVGVVFSVTTNGANFTIVHSITSSDGADPEGGLILLGNTLYGTTSGGGTGAGVVFSVATNGTDFTIVHNFIGSDGADPQGALILSGNTLYGTTFGGGSYGGGTVFGLSLPVPQLAISLSGTNVILTWPTNPPGFSLQSTTTLSPLTWNTNLPAPVIVNGQYTITNPICTQQFYQLSL